MRALLGGIVLAGLLVSPAFPQSSTGAWSDLPDRFQIDTGYFRINADTVLRLNGEPGATTASPPSGTSASRSGRRLASATSG